MKIIRPIQFDKPRKEARRKTRNEAAKARARIRRAKERDCLQRRLYRMIEPSFDILWEAHHNDNNKPSRRK